MSLGPDDSRAKGPEDRPVRELATRFANEPRRYTAAKHDFVTEVERRAGVRA